MPDISDPLIQGLMAGIQFKQYFQNANRQAEELRMRKEQMAEARQQRERQNELTDLQMRLKLATHPGVTELAPGQTSRPVSFPEQDIGARGVGIPAAPDMTGETLPGGLEAPPSIAARMESPRSIRTMPATAGNVPVDNAIDTRWGRFAPVPRAEQQRTALEQMMTLAEMKRRETEASWVTINTPQGPIRVPPQSAGTNYRGFNPPPPKPVAPPKPPPETPGAANTRRRREWIDLGKEPKGPDYTSYVLTGKLPTPKGTTGGTGSLAADRFQFAKEEAAARKAEAARKEQEAEDAKKEAKMQALLAEEEKHHSARATRGAELTSDELDKKKRPEIAAQYTGATQAIQDVQHRKAKLLGAAIPPKAAQDSLKEGESRTAPDGHVWYKKDSIVYIVK